MIAEAVAENPKAELVIMEKHGLVTWGDTAKECYDQTISIIQEAEAYIGQKAKDVEMFGGKKHETLPEEERKNLLTKILPVIRGEVTEDKRMIVSYDDSE